MGNNLNIIHLIKKSLLSIFEKENGRKASCREIAELYDIIDKEISEPNGGEGSNHDEGMEMSYKYTPYYKRNRNRHTIIWHFLIFLKAYRDLCNGAQDFYDYKKIIKSLYELRENLESCIRQMMMYLLLLDIAKENIIMACATPR